MITNYLERVEYCDIYFILLLMHTVVIFMKGLKESYALIEYPEVSCRRAKHSRAQVVSVLESHAPKLAQGRGSSSKRTPETPPCPLPFHIALVMSLLSPSGEFQFITITWPSL
uniref:M1627_1334 protein n=1 Tax=Fopius arisanus TaxID=64838 RepID=A0A0C9RRC2_9HYME